MNYMVAEMSVLYDDLIKAGKCMSRNPGKNIFGAGLLLAGLLCGAGCAFADVAPATSVGQNPQEPDFSPPPVPGFMLRRPEKPLTLEQMQQQADEAAHRARAGKDGAAQPAPPTPAETGER